MLPDKIEHCIVFMNYWDVSGVFWSFSKCNIKIPHLPADPSSGTSSDKVQAPQMALVVMFDSTVGGDPRRTNSSTSPSAWAVDDSTGQLGKPSGTVCRWVVLEEFSRL